MLLKIAHLAIELTRTERVSFLPIIPIQNICKNDIPFAIIRSVTRSATLFLFSSAVVLRLMLLISCF